MLINKKILFTFPNEILKNNIWENDDLIILDDYGFWVYDINISKRILKNQIKKFEDLTNIRDEINCWSPVYERWILESFLHEQKKIRSITLINQIIVFLKKYKINNVFFSTGSPHHIQDVLVSVSCQKLKINQFYFYTNVFDSRLIVLKQNGSIYDREVFLYKKNKNKYEKIINEFIKNAQKNNSPKDSMESSIRYYNNSYLFIYFFLLARGLKRFIFKRKKVNINKPFHFREDRLSYTNSIRIIRRQRNFLKKYKKESLNQIKFIKETKNKKTLIIAGHYQPEATSFPDGGSYSNHIEIIHKLRSLGYDEKIYYKEHPASQVYYDPPSYLLTKVSIYKNIEFIDHLKNYDCGLLPFDFKIEKFKESNYIPITIGGTIAIERALSGLKTIICGEPYFKRMPGIIHINEIKNKKFIEELSTDYDKNIKVLAKKYLLKILDNNTFLNPYGIGSGFKLDDDLSESKKQLNDFFNHLNNPKNNLLY